MANLSRAFLKLLWAYFWYFRQGHPKKYHGHFCWSKIVTGVFSMSRAFLRKLSRAPTKMSREKKTLLTGKWAAAKRRRQISHFFKNFVGNPFENFTK